MLLCISHQLSCRYCLGYWDAEAEEFVPETHGRMNWQRPKQSIYEPVYRDFFAPASVKRQMRTGYCGLGWQHLMKRSIRNRFNFRRVS